MDDKRRRSGAAGRGSGWGWRAAKVGLIGVVVVGGLMLALDRSWKGISAEDANGPEARAEFAETYPEIQKVVQRYIARALPRAAAGGEGREWRGFLEKMQVWEMAADYGPPLLGLVKRSREEALEYGEMIVMLTLLVDWHTMYEKDGPGWVGGALAKLGEREPFEGAAGLIAYARAARMQDTEAVPYLEAHMAELKLLAGARGRNGDLALMLRAVGCQMERLDDVDIGLLLLAKRNNALYTRTRVPGELVAGFQALVDDLAALARTAGMTEKQKTEAGHLQEAFARALKEYQMQARSVAKTEAAIEEAGKKIQAYVATHGGKLPPDDAGRAEIANDRDLWGHALRYSRQSESRYEIRSAGPDGRFDLVENLDDIVRTFTTGAAQ